MSANIISVDEVPLDTLLDEVTSELVGGRAQREDGAQRARRNACLHGIPAGALAPDQDEQRDRAHQPREQEDEGRRALPGRQLGIMLVTTRLKYIAEHEWGKRRGL